ncbi:hypothetical protein DICVIV_07374 [Dictyocaulus viviparus]|uniref:Uncharacterized protein n=1 Tax=Dictyocaulus viviparus TaxID=29172 RepID=A0A0D8XW15_DICVI|nr:hypothetical protein DICVIV_07374 [Dictyocaulus viviparus]
MGPNIGVWADVMRDRNTRRSRRNSTDRASVTNWLSCRVTLVSTYGTAAPSSSLYHLEMSVSDEPDSGGVSGLSDTKSDEEERYRLKILALQECYGSVQLQTFRLRERIYNVRKQCRRLEGMKRAALNLLRYYTGTYDIPPLEIVDEDPVPSFLESLQKQQSNTPETPRKKPKRPSRSKSDGKLTPEEEERAKQKICSIIDSVYSETARRMVQFLLFCVLGDLPKRSFRSLNPEGSISNGGVTKKGRNLFHTIYKDDERNTGKSTEVEKSCGDSNLSSLSIMQFGIHSTPDMEDEERERNAVTPYNSTESSHSHDSALNENHSLTQSLVCNGQDGASESIRFNATKSLYKDILEYDDNVQNMRDVSYETNLQSNQFHTLDEIRPDNYDASLSNMVGGNACLDNDETNYNENTHPLNMIDYATVLGAVQAMSDINLARLEPNHPARHSTPLSYEDVVTTLTKIVTVDRLTSSEEIDAESEDVELSNTQTNSPLAKGTENLQVNVQKQEMQKSVINDKSSDFSPPNFIPYRMITVENSKPTEIITADPSGDEVSQPKQLQTKRRRKYKYVVESVLDNVPYTFRQAESDDDESNDKNPTNKASLGMN